QHRNSNVPMTFNATLTDGSPLPTWLAFDRNSGIFSGQAPQGWEGSFEVRVIARDANGGEAVIRFKISVMAQTDSAQPPNATPPETEDRPVAVDDSDLMALLLNWEQETS